MSQTLDQFRLTDRAAARIAEIVAAEGERRRPARRRAGRRLQRLPVPLRPGPRRSTDDLVIERAGATVFVDPASLDLLAGSELDYNDELMGAISR